MESHLLQDWTTIQGASSTTAITQTARGYLDVAEYQDAALWLYVSSVNFPVGGGTLALQYETAPSYDEMTFVPVVPPIQLTAALTAPLVKKVLQAYARVPLAKFLRWKLQVTGLATFDWDVTFRIWVCANAAAA